MFSKCQLLKTSLMMFSNIDNGCLEWSSIGGKKCSYMEQVFRDSTSVCIKEKGCFVSGCCVEVGLILKDEITFGYGAEEL